MLLLAVQRPMQLWSFGRALLAMRCKSQQQNIWVTSAVMQAAAKGKRAHGNASKDAAKRRSGVLQMPAGKTGGSAESDGLAAPASKTGGKLRWA